MASCQVCGQENPDGFRFCGACGAEIGPLAARREVRKTVTVVFCDVSGSTALGERLDPEAMRRTMGRYFEEIRLIVARHGGMVEKFIGDAAMAVFGIPVAHEDDALRAVRAVAEIRERLTVLGEELSVALSFRTGVNTGEVVAGEGKTLVTGDAVNVAARLEQAASPGEILIGAETLLLVRDAVTVEPVEPLALKGKRDPVAAFRLVAVDMEAEAFARHLDAPLVGRVREQQRLRADFEDVVSERACHMFTLLGPAGVGKSRLVAEFLKAVGETADVLRSRCLHYGEDITYWPLVEILIAIGVVPDDLIAISPADTQLQFRKLLETRATERPQVVVLDDIQWAEPVFLDLIEHVADWSRDAPIFLLCVARPELLELRPGWGGGKLNATTILLEALSADDCELLIGELVGGSKLAPGTRARILQAAAGNPLFIEEMLALVDDADDDSEIVVPPTIQALLQSRLDRLGAGERDLIGRGAVEGEVFHLGTVKELAPELQRAEVPGHLRSLIRKEVIRSDRPTFPDEEAFRFRHLLIRDAAYDSLPKQTRAELHEQFANWLKEHGSLVEQDEIVGYHLERAYRNRAELDSADESLEGLGRRAAACLFAAGHAAETRGDMGATGGLFLRTAALLPEGDTDRLEALLHAAFPLNLVGRPDEARRIATELAASSDERFNAYGLLVENMNNAYVGTWVAARGEANVVTTRETFERHDDQRGLAWTGWAEWEINWLACRAEKGRAAAVRGEAHARAAGDRVLALRLREGILILLALGPTPVDEALATAKQMLNETAGVSALATYHGVVAKLLAMTGDAEAAREHVQAAARGRIEAGEIIESAALAHQVAFVEVRAGDTLAAENALMHGIAELERAGNASYRGTACLSLAKLLANRGADDEAARWCAVARRTISDDDLVDTVVINGLEGLLAARRGDHALAEQLTARSVEVAATIDTYESKSDGYELRARALALAGRQAEARSAAAAALAVVEAKGDQPATRWLRELVDSLSG